MWACEDWKDYILLDARRGARLESWGKAVLDRPDPQAIWKESVTDADWAKADAKYHRSNKGGGQWEYRRSLPEQWTIRFEDLTFCVKPTGFKHTGLFPEQAVNWQWMRQKIRNAGRPIKVLNLFAYTGGATMACAKEGASVCHVDASKGILLWAKDNARACGLESAPIRYLADDARKFVEREIRRGNTYDAIIMDPPSYGRGTNGEVWTMEEEIFGLLNTCTKVLSDRPLFFVLNGYTTGLAPSVLKNLLALTVGKAFGGKLTTDEIGLPIGDSGLYLPCGATGRWEE